MDPQQQQPEQWNEGEKLPDHVSGSPEDWSWVNEVTLPRLPPRDSEVIINIHRPESNTDFDAGNRRGEPFKLQRLRSTARELADSYSRLNNLHGEVMILRNQGIYERQEWTRQTRFFMQSQNELADQLLKIEATEASRDRIKFLQEQLREDSISLQERDRNAVQIETELSQKEFELHDQEAVLAQTSEELFQLLSAFDVSAAQGVQSASPQAHASKSAQQSTKPSLSERPPALQEYFDKVGIVGWRMDRLLELQTEYRESCVDRSFRKDHEETLQVADEAFENEFSDRLAEAEHALEMATKDADQAKEKCVAQNLDPDAHRRRISHEVQGISLLPITPDEEMQEFAAIVNSSSPVYPALLSERDPSSTMLTTLTGNLHHDGLPQKRKKT